MTTATPPAHPTPLRPDVLACHEHDLAELGERLDRRGLPLARVLDAVRRFDVAVPSWALGTGGTRFGRFPGPGEPRCLEEKLDDAAVVHELTGATPRVSLHITWDEPRDPVALREHAGALGLGFDAVNSNTFQDQPGQSLSYKLGSFSHPDPAVRGQAIEHHLHVIEVGAASIDGWVSLARGAAAVAIMDPMSGRTGLARVRRQPDGTAGVYLQLAPGAALVLRTFERPTTGPAWTYEHDAGPALALRGRWSVRFVEGGPALPAAFESDSLVAWTGRGDAGADRFAGTARYSLRFDAPDGAAEHVLELGRVAESARVRLNGRDLGTVFAAPFRLRTGRLQPTGNVLEIEETNLSANRIRDLDVRKVQWKVFRDINYVGIDYKPFDASGWSVRPSGLLGPVTLRPVSASAPGA